MSWAISKHSSRAPASVIAGYGSGLVIPGVLIAESFTSFPGLGGGSRGFSWGVLIVDGAREIRPPPWQLIFPAALLTVTLFAVNVLGGHWRDALDGVDRC